MPGTSQMAAISLAIPHHNGLSCNGRQNEKGAAMFTYTCKQICSGGRFSLTESHHDFTV
jgi:hypothetical protein